MTPEEKAAKRKAYREANKEKRNAKDRARYALKKLGKEQCQAAGAYVPKNNPKPT
jgi:hypothetical protein